MSKRGAVLRTAFESFTVATEIGAGGAGTVCAVRDQAGIDFAAKVLRPGLPKEKLRRFRNEVMFGVRETHPNLVKILDYGTTDTGEPFYIMPLASGTLRSVMADSLKPEALLELFSQVLDGVEAAHMKGVYHRDLKPENILANHGEPLRVADFGIAHFGEEALHTQIQTRESDRLANWEYAAPEQRRMGGRIDHRADIYALGLILTEMLTGSVPHGLGSKKIADTQPELAYLDEIAEAMRQHEASARPASIAEVKRLLLARRNVFVEQQKLDRLRNIVVRESEVTEPLVNDPPRLMNVRYTGSAVIFELSRAVDSNWVSMFRGMPLGGLVGYGPEYHTFQGSTVQVRATEHLAQRLVDQFKSYLEEANARYALDVVRKQREREQSERFKLAAEIAEKERLAKIQESLRW